MSLTGDVLGQIGAEVSLNGGVGGSIQFTGEGTDNYDELDNRPSINGVVLTGNKTTEDLHIDTGGTDDYLDLNNKPKINSVTLRGDVSSTSLQISYNDLIDRPVIPDLTDLENRMDAVEGDIQGIETDIGDIGDRLVDIASDIATIQATDLVQNSDISSLKNRVTAAETTITNLGSRLTTAEGTISTHTSDISDLDDRLDTAEGNISDAQNDISDLQGDVSQLNSSKVSKVNTQLTLTRTANNYVDATSFARLAAVRKDNVLFFICNLALTSSIPASALSDFVEIGRISGWSSAYTIMQQIPSQQSDGNSLSIRISSNGIVSIYAVKAASSWYRTVVSIPASN